MPQVFAAVQQTRNGKIFTCGKPRIHRPVDNVMKWVTDWENRENLTKFWGS